MKTVSVHLIFETNQLNDTIQEFFTKLMKQDIGALLVTGGKPAVGDLNIREDTEIKL